MTVTIIVGVVCFVVGAVMGHNSGCSDGNQGRGG